MQENKDYELIPAETTIENDLAWDVRIKTGDFIETIVRYGNISIDGKKDQMNFNFSVISSPIEDLNEDDKDLQEFMGLMLQSIIMNGIQNGELIMDEK